MIGRRRTVLCLLCLVAATGLLAGTSGAAGIGVDTATEATSEAAAAIALAEQSLPIAVGGFLLGAGLGATIASGATYWYKNREFEGRLR
ncbi:hypothetical protein A6E15_17100 [Natrinema saccharevitans]|uniref:Uncharacterized protein n=1 Tax=Natrinema saccharevitans TaxID=301967 RepID=A0A1S8B0V3_9EURY|nr:hypothetical protein [Natrinema saccharevitans]OLZ42572.1 hypothetical protein A6E15_17100 [Natrinema saccharevitans]